MIDDLQLAGLSGRTEQAYVRAVRQLAEHYDLPPDQISEQQLRDYLLYLKNHKEFAAGSLKVAFNGIKFFYRHTEPRDWETLQSLRIPKQRTLPDVLTPDEVRELIAAVRTVHNRTYLWTVYSCGLRLTEGLHLQVGDIDGRRKMVHVHRGKGAKDRYVILPSVTLTRLREYWSTHRHPRLLFPAVGRSGKQAAQANGPMGRASVQGALKRVVQQVGIRKSVTMHTLRHSYASHLIEAGVSVRRVQQLLGHSSLQTTMIYLHLTEPGEQAVRQIIEGLMGE
jgi:site-specific recombinase XerD